MAFLSQASHLGSLLLPHNAFQEHAAHRAEWSAQLSSKGSERTCIRSGLATFLHCAFTAHPNLVVTPRASHNMIDLSIRYPHDVSSAPMAICTEGDTWDRPPYRHATTGPSPSTFTMRRPTLRFSTTPTRLSSSSSPSSSPSAFSSSTRPAAARVGA